METLNIADSGEQLTTFDNSGCGRKIPPDELEALLGIARAELGALDSHDQVLKIVGRPLESDCAVIDEGDGRLRVETIDMVLPMGIDPEKWGAIVALHCLSDVYAAGAVPASSMAMFEISNEWLDTGAHVAAYRGACHKIASEGAPVVGGHTLRAETTRLGFAVTANASAAHLRGTDQAGAEDSVWLTKPVGASAVLAGAAFGALAESLRNDVVTTMLASNRLASHIATEIGVRCSSDVSGFGLLGCLWQIAKASDVEIRLEAESVPRFEGAISAIQQGVISTLAERLFLSLGDRTEWTTQPHELQFLLCDPQVNGGLVLILPQQLEHDLRRAAEAAGQPIWRIGTVVRRGTPGVGVE